MKKVLSKITGRAVLGWTLLFIGVACWLFAFCSSPTAVNVDEVTFMCFTKTEWIYFALMVVVIIIGSICILLGIKVNPEPFIKVLYEDDEPEEEKPCLYIHNYSVDFEELYEHIQHQQEHIQHQQILTKVDELISLIEKENADEQTV